MSDTGTTTESSEEVTGPFKDPPLTMREHMDTDKHWIGESLPAPTQSEIAGTVGMTSGPGDSPFPARADHTHKIDPTLLLRGVSWTPSVSAHTLGTGGFVTGIARAQKISGSALSEIFVACYIAYGPGGGPTGDMGIILPFTSSLKFVGIGFAEATNRFNITWYTTAIDSNSAGIRSLIYRPTATEATRPTELSVAMNNILPAQTWGAGSFIMLSGTYFTSQAT